MDSIIIEHNQTEYPLSAGKISLLELAEYYQGDYQGKIVLALKNNRLCELHKKAKRGDRVLFLDTTDKDGYRTLQRSLSFLFIRSVCQVYEGQTPDVVIQFSLNHGFYCEIRLADEQGTMRLETVTPEILAAIRQQMKDYAEADLSLEKKTKETDRAISIFEKQAMLDKARLLTYRRASNTNVYRLDGLYDYFYGYMVPSTSYLKTFDLFAYDEGIVLQFPKRDNPKQVADFKPDQLLFKTQKRSTEWGTMIKVEDVAELNDFLKTNRMKELILMTEATMERRIGKIAETIIKSQFNKKFVFVSGPSSSGKTTFSHRLAIHLKTYGVSANVISLDNYFVDRDKTPLDEDGNYDFETIEAVDIESFNQDMTDLLAGKTVDIPTFNFLTGKREYKKNYLSLGEHDLLIIEGIHGLNERLSYLLPSESKYKIYISALTQLNIDHHNRIPTTDARLLRRIVRDYQYRGASAAKTIAMWPSVRRGEEKYIFPFQEQADTMFNSAHVYELSILKQYAEPLLFSVPETAEEIIEAKRLIKFLSYFLGASSEYVPRHSIIREFIGNSTFRT